MARSHSVWVVTHRDPSTAHPIAAFTVKHELKTWLTRRRKLPLVWVYRLGDGAHDENKLSRFYPEDILD